MIDDIKLDAESRMKKSVSNVREALTRIRTGRASPALLEHLTVDYYGVATPINQVATVSAADARTLTVQPWERSMLAPIERAILESDLGLNPVTAGETMRIPLPPMTEERRVSMVKVVKSEGEEGKIAIRNIRRDAIGTVRDLLKEKEITQDEEKQTEGELQQLTDRYVAQIDEVVSEKEREVMEV
ncbi:MAG: ribosome recycling factor [Gammaproteobacteria bacterium]|nr:ribosome recycling factor [Gammaproteobacteria bacterium]MDE0716289.1 ribosome recycling factor [Gammaproteobacteria bacterium]MXX17011.1 ribosome recycling factor [Gammaproteobacteria bacterium]MXY66321.1 ribosome recycling factor [Gammaproteobacteria bacterium]MYG66392.1 ribosome recycling factor [Gammaproteobacteria bacterium]